MPTASARDFKPLTWPRWTRIKAIIFPPVSDQNACDVTIDADYNVYIMFVMEPFTASMGCWTAKVEIQSCFICNGLH